jgi:Methyltransferase domain
MSASTWAAIDPFVTGDAGVYRDPYVEVRAHHGVRSRRALGMVRTAHFDVQHVGPRVHVTHHVPPERIDHDLSGLLADELFQPGWLRGPELFERLFTGVVLSTDPDPLAGWTRFYVNTLDRIEESLHADPGGHAHGTIADYAPVYGLAESLLATGSVLELGSCFGFLSLRLASAGRQVTASDISPGTVALLATVAPRLGVDLAAVTADAARTPWADGAADTVLAVHLLEHLEPPDGDRVLAEALRLARQRVVVAVPLEDEADETWGHVRTVSLADLDAWGARSGFPYVVAEDHGGWLVVDVAR